MHRNIGNPEVKVEEEVSKKDDDDDDDDINNNNNNNNNNTYPHQPPSLYLVICNIQKISNVKAMLLASIAFGCNEVLLVGQERNSQRKDMFPLPFAEAVKKGLIRMNRFTKWKHCVSYIKKKKIILIGVEIDETSQLLNDDYFETHYPTNQKDIGVLLGNEGQGILPVFLKSCHSLIQIPQYGVGTASMNVNVATSIVLYKFQDYKRKLIRKDQCLSRK